MRSDHEALAGEVLETIEAAAALIQTFESFAATLREFHHRLDDAGRLEDLYRELNLATERDSMYGAIAVFEQAFLRTRIRTYRSLYDDEGMTFTELGRLTGRSRQWVTKMYKNNSS